MSHLVCVMKKSNSIFMIGWEYPPHNSGGLGVACQGLTEALAEQSQQLYFTLPYSLPQSVGHMKVLDCSHPDWQLPKNQPPFFAYDAVDHLQASIDGVTERKLDLHQLHLLPQSDLEKQVMQYHDQVVQKSKSADFSVIHAHDWMSFPAGMALKEKTKKPLITHVHSTEFDRSPHGGSYYIQKTEYEGMRMADVIIAVSAYTKHLLVAKYGIDPKKIQVVHNGISPLVNSDSGRHHFAASRPVVAFMGRLTGQKGPEHFLKIARVVLKQMPEALFVIAGHGDLYQELLFSSADMGLSGKVLFSGFVRDKQRDKLLDRADVFVMPSLSEPFGLVAVEAAQRSTPVIISKNSGVSEVLPHSLQADFWDINLMAKQIVDLLSNHEHAQEVVTKQHQDLEPVTWKSAAQKVKEIYSRALGLS